MSNDDGGRDVVGGVGVGVDDSGVDDVGVGGVGVDGVGGSGGMCGDGITPLFEYSNTNTVFKRSRESSNPQKNTHYNQHCRTRT